MTEFIISEPDNSENNYLDDMFTYDGDDLHIGNGDAVVVYSGQTGATCLGTGMTCLEDVVQATIRRIGVSDNEKFEVFLPAGGMYFSKES